MREVRLEETDSTNNFAKLHLDEFADKTVIYAMRQNYGRGRLNRIWVDLGEGNLFMSVVLKPSDKHKEVFPNLTQYLSVCLCKILENYGLKPQIKWPNDVLINGKKIAGILSESVMQSGGRFKGIVLGIGVNLNAEQKDIDAIPDKIATALNLEINKVINTDEFRKNLVNEFFSNYEKFLEQGFEYIKHDYISRNCFLDKELNIQVFNEIKSGVAKSVSDRGELVLQKDNNEFVLTIGDIL